MTKPLVSPLCSGLITVLLICSCDQNPAGEKRQTNSSTGSPAASNKSTNTTLNTPTIKSDIKERTTWSQPIGVATNIKILEATLKEDGDNNLFYEKLEQLNFRKFCESDPKLALDTILGNQNPRLQVLLFNTLKPLLNGSNLGGWFIDRLRSGEISEPLKDLISRSDLLARAVPLEKLIEIANEQESWLAKAAAYAAGEKVGNYQNWLALLETHVGSFPDEYKFLFADTALTRFNSPSSWSDPELKITFSDVSEFVRINKISSPGVDTNTYLADVYDKMALMDPTGALKQLIKEDFPDKDYAVQTVFNRWQIKDESAALGWIDRLESSEFKDGLVGQTIAANIHTRTREQLTQWADRLSIPHNRKKIRELYGF